MIALPTPLFKVLTCLNLHVTANLPSAWHSACAGTNAEILPTLMTRVVATILRVISAWFHHRQN